MNKFFNRIKKALDRVNNLSDNVNDQTTFKVDRMIQASIKQLYDGTQDSNVKKLLRCLLRIGKIGGKIATVVLLLVGVVSMFFGVATALLGPILVLKAIAVVVRIAADIGSGRSLAYSFGKAATLWGAGVAAQEAAQSVLTYFNQTIPSIESRDPNAAINTGLDREEVNSVRSGSINTGPDREEVNSVRSGLGQAANISGEPLQSPTLPPIPLTTPLEQEYGSKIPSFSGDFKTAFAAARAQLGAGHLFHWGDDVYPTNTKEEGFYKGFSNAVKTLLQQGVK
jgi:hypothetical protein